MGNKVCRALFHRDSFGPVISLGEPKRGGSVLRLDGTKLLDTEWFYLLETGVCLMVIVGGRCQSMNCSY